jgi:hypothetical protein
MLKRGKMKIKILLILILLSFVQSFAENKTSIRIVPKEGFIEYYYIPEDNKSIIIGINYYSETGFTKKSELIKVSFENLCIIWKHCFNSKITGITADKQGNYISFNGFISEEKGSFKYIVNGKTGQILDSLYQVKVLFLNTNGKIIYTSDRMITPGSEIIECNTSIYIKDIKLKQITEIPFSWPIVCFYNVEDKIYLVATNSIYRGMGEKYISIEDGVKSLKCPVTIATSDKLLIYNLKNLNTIDLKAEIEHKIFFEDVFCYGIDDNTIIVDDTKDLYGNLYNFQGAKGEIPIINDVDILKKAKYICPRYYEYTSDFYYKDMKDGRIYIYNIRTEDDSLSIKSIFNNLSNYNNKITLQNNFLINHNKINIIIGKIIDSKKMVIKKLLK